MQKCLYVYIYNVRQQFHAVLLIEINTDLSILLFMCVFFDGCSVVIPISACFSTWKHTMTRMWTFQPWPLSSSSSSGEFHWVNPAESPAEESLRCACVWAGLSTAGGTGQPSGFKWKKVWITCLKTALEQWFSIWEWQTLCGKDKKKRKKKKVIILLNQLHLK